MKVAVIGDRSMVQGFGLLGIRDGIVAERPREAEDALAELSADPDCGLIIISAALAGEIHASIRGIQSEKRVYPLIVEIPVKSGGVSAEDPVRSLVRRAIGVDISEKGGEDL